MVVVSADNPATQWVRYNGHFGKHLGKPSFTNATEVWGAPFGIGRRAIVNTIAAAASKMKEFAAGSATLALGARHYIQRPRASDWKHIHVYAAQDVVSALGSRHNLDHEHVALCHLQHIRYLLCSHAAYILDCFLNTDIWQSALCIACIPDNSQNELMSGAAAVHRVDVS